MLAAQTQFDFRELDQNTWLADRSETIAAWEFARITWLTASSDEATEHVRRADLASVAIAAVWLVLGIPVGAALDELNRRAGLLHTGLSLLTVTGALVVIISACRLADALVGPASRRQGSRGAVLSAVVGVLAILVAAMVVLLIPRP